MATIQQQIDVEADPKSVREAWRRFIQWAHNGPDHLTCDETACVDAIRLGLVEFVPASGGPTRVTFRVDELEAGPGAPELRRQLSHILVVFKDYVERSGLARRKPAETEETALEHDSGRQGDKPRHVRLSSENDTTFWRSHFPT